ncbi:MAG: cytochrome c [Pseudomonadota bacterium]
MRIAAIALLLSACALFAQPASAQGDPDKGKDLAYTCLGCHGIEGYRNAYPSYRVPKLGGQKAAYLIDAIKGYRDGLRKHPTMQAQAVSLTDEEVADISAYLATLGTDTVESGGTTGASLERAQVCVACHGQNGISVNPMWPSLAGQHEEYLVHALNQYRNGERSQAVMAAQAQLLTDEDVAVLARYYSSMSGLETTKPED